MKKRLKVMTKEKFEYHGGKVIISTDLENKKILVEYNGKEKCFPYTEELAAKLPDEDEDCFIYELSNTMVNLWPVVLMIILPLFFMLGVTLIIDLFS